MAKLVILVIDADNAPIYAIGRALWRRNAQQHGIPLFFLRSDPRITDETLIVDGDCLYSKWIGSRTDWVDGMHERINDKTLKALQYCHEYLDCDYVLRTNLSSFYRLDALNAFLDQAPRSLFYGGPLQRLTIPVEEGGDYTLDYVSGSGILLSRDLIPPLLGRKKDVPMHHVDDVWIGVSLLKLPRRDVPRCDLEDVDDLSADNIFKIVDRLRTAEAQGVFHFRIKNAGKFPRQVLDSLVFGMLAERYL